MTVTIAKDIFASAVQAASSVANNKATSTIGKSIRLVAENGQLHVRATDMTNWMRLSLPCDGEMALIMVDANKLNDLASSLRGDLVKLDVDGGTLTIKTKGGGSRKIKGMDIPFPDPPAIDGDPITFEIAALRDAMDFCANCMSDDVSVKPELCGVHLHGREGRYEAAAFSGSSLAVAHIGEGHGELSATISANTLKMMSHLPRDGQVQIRLSDRRVSMTWSVGEMAASLVEGKFPPYWTIAPDHDHELEIDAVELLSVMTAIEAVGTDESASKSKRYKLALADQVRLLVASQYGEGDEPMDATWTGPEFEMGFAGKRMGQALKGFGKERVFIGISDYDPVISKTKAIRIRSDAKKGKAAYVMPLAVK